jgi:hypothetical protein
MDDRAADGRQVVYETVLANGNRGLFLVTVPAPSALELGLVSLLLLRSLRLVRQKQPAPRTAPSANRQYARYRTF